MTANDMELLKRIQEWEESPKSEERTEALADLHRILESNRKDELENGPVVWE